MNPQLTTYITKLRALADWLETHGETLPEPELWSSYASVAFRFATKADLAEAIKGKGSFRKDFFYETFQMSKTLGDETHPRVLISFKIARDEVCVKRTVRKLVPAEEAKPAVPEHEVEEDVWDCPKSVLDKLAEAETNLVRSVS